MKRAICIVNEHPSIQEFCDLLKQINTRAEERKAFVQKQLDAINEKINKEYEVVWRHLRDELNSKFAHAMGNFNEEKHYLCLNSEEGVITMVDNADVNSFGILRNLLNIE